MKGWHCVVCNEDHIGKFVYCPISGRVRPEPVEVVLGQLRDHTKVMDYTPLEITGDDCRVILAHIDDILAKALQLVEQELHHALNRTDDRDFEQLIIRIRNRVKNGLAELASGNGGAA